MNAIHNKILAMLACMVLSLAMTACKSSIDDTSANCPRGQVVTLRVDGPNNNADDGAAVQDAVIYVFDKDGNLLEARATQVNKPETFNYPNAGPLTFVGWINTASTADGQVVVTSATPGTKESTLDVSQVPNGIVRDLTTYYDSPSDLFYGNATAVNLTNGKPETLDLYAVRQVGQMKVTVRGLPLLHDYSTTDVYTISVGTTQTALGFDGVLTGPQGGLMPTAAFDPSTVSGDFVTPAFNIFPSNAPMTVTVYKNGVPIATATVDVDGKPITSAANKTTNVLIEFASAGTFTLTIDNSLWGVITIWPFDFAHK